MQHETLPAHEIIWDEPSPAHTSTWQGPPAFDFSVPVAPAVIPGHDDHDDSEAHINRANSDEHFGALPEPASYAEAPAQSRSGLSTAGTAEVGGQEDDEELAEDALTIGRSRSNGIVLDDMLVSRHHVVITADDDGLLLRDLNSRNGTFVNGLKVEQTHLREGDRIGIGASTFEVRDGWLAAV